MIREISDEALRIYDGLYTDLATNYKHLRIKKIACMIFATGFAAFALISPLYCSQYSVVILSSAIMGIGLTMLFFSAARKSFISNFSHTLTRPCDKPDILFMDIAARNADSFIFNTWIRYPIQVQVPVSENEHEETFHVKRIFSRKDNVHINFWELVSKGYLGVLRADYPRFPKDFSKTGNISCTFLDSTYLDPPFYDTRVVLPMAAEVGNIQIIRACVQEFNIPVNTAVHAEKENFELKKTSLCFAVEEGQTEAIRELIRLQALDGHDTYELLTTAAYYNQPNSIRTLIELIPSLRDKITRRSEKTISPVHIAMNYAYHDVLTILLELNVDILSTDHNGKLPIEGVFYTELELARMHVPKFRFGHVIEKEKILCKKAKLHAVKLLLSSSQGQQWLKNDALDLEQLFRSFPDGDLKNRVITCINEKRNQLLQERI